MRHVDIIYITLLPSYIFASCWFSLMLIDFCLLLSFIDLRRFAMPPPRHISASPPSIKLIFSLFIFLYFHFSITLFIYFFALSTFSLSIDFLSLLFELLLRHDDFSRDAAFRHYFFVIFWYIRLFFRFHADSLFLSPLFSPCCHASLYVCCRHAKALLLFSLLMRALCHMRHACHAIYARALFAYYFTLFESGFIYFAFHSLPLLMLLVFPGRRAILIFLMAMLRLCLRLLRHMLDDAADLSRRRITLFFFFFISIAISFLMPLSFLIIFADLIRLLLFFLPSLDISLSFFIVAYFIFSISLDVAFLHFISLFDYHFRCWYLFFILFSLHCLRCYYFLIDYCRFHFRFIIWRQRFFSRHTPFSSSLIASSPFRRFDDFFFAADFRWLLDFAILFSAMLLMPMRYIRFLPLYMMLRRLMFLRRLFSLALRTLTPSRFDTFAAVIFAICRCLLIFALPPRRFSLSSSLFALFDFVCWQSSENGIIRLSDFSLLFSLLMFIYFSLPFFAIFALILFSRWLFSLHWCLLMMLLWLIFRLLDAACFRAFRRCFFWWRFSPNAAYAFAFSISSRRQHFLCRTLLAMLADFRWLRCFSDILFSHFAASFSCLLLIWYFVTLILITLSPLMLTLLSFRFSSILMLSLSFSCCLMLMFSLSCLLLMLITFSPCLRWLRCCFQMPDASLLLLFAMLLRFRALFADFAVYDAAAAGFDILLAFRVDASFSLSDASFIFFSLIFSIFLIDFSCYFHFIFSLIAADADAISFSFSLLFAFRFSGIIWCWLFDIFIIFFAFSSMLSMLMLMLLSLMLYFLFFDTFFFAMPRRHLPCCHWCFIDWCHFHWFSSCATFRWWYFHFHFHWLIFYFDVSSLFSPCRCHFHLLISSLMLIRHYFHFSDFSAFGCHFLIIFDAAFRRFSDTPFSLFSSIFSPCRFRFFRAAAVDFSFHVFFFFLLMPCCFISASLSFLFLMITDISLIIFLMAVFLLMIIWCFVFFFFRDTRDFRCLLLIFAWLIFHFCCCQRLPTFLCRLSFRLLSYDYDAWCYAAAADYFMLHTDAAFDFFVAFSLISSPIFSPPLLWFSSRHMIFMLYAARFFSFPSIFIFDILMLMLIFIIDAAIDFDAFSADFLCCRYFRCCFSLLSLSLITFSPCWFRCRHFSPSFCHISLLRFHWYDDADFRRFDLPMFNEMPIFSALRFSPLSLTLLRLPPLLDFTRRFASALCCCFSPWCHFRWRRLSLISLRYAFAMAPQRYATARFLRFFAITLILIDYLPSIFIFHYFFFSSFHIFSPFLFLLLFRCFRWHTPLTFLIFDYFIFRHFAMPPFLPFICHLFISFALYISRYLFFI